MVEGTKQVRVDNWGVFFLQRLQMFFNKTDYCDLTLQFEGNVQLKVHRLVINACTDYFTYLEQTRGLHGDILIMPPDLQADVVLPIVNFMYTGMLDFHMSVFEKLYKTAELMNITVLTKLLDALKNSSQPHKIPAKKRPPAPPTPSAIFPAKKPVKTETDLPAPLPGRKLPVWKRKTVPSPMAHPASGVFMEMRKPPPDPLALYDSTPKPTRFEWPDEELSTTFNLFSSTFDDISYTSKPLLTQEFDPRPSTSFDKNKDYQDKSAALGTCEEAKEFLKEPRRRSNLSEFNADENGSEIICGLPEVQKRKSDDKSESPVVKKVRFNVSEKENQNNKTPKLNIMSVGKTSPDFSHSKIISEVLKRYPHIVKKNKNIKLKILAKNSNLPLSPDKVQSFKTSTSTMRVQVMNQIDEKGQKSDGSDKKEDGPWRCLKCSTPTEPCDFVLYYLYRKHMTDVHNEKFDSRMCKYCGHKCIKHNMLMYHQYTKHGIKPPPAYHFPKCNQCPYIALTESLLIKHKLNHTNFDLQCPECRVAFNNQHHLSTHTQITGHTGKSGRTNFDCQYCSKKYQNGANLFSHIKMHHREEARRDGVVSVDEEDNYEDMDEEQMDAAFEQIGEQQQEQDEGEEDGEYLSSEMRADKREKIKILSNVKVDNKHNQNSQQEEQHSITLQQHSSESEALTNVASGIATSLGLVDIVVLDDNQQYILHSNNQHLTPTSSQSSTHNQTEFILPELTDTHTFTTSQQSSDQGIINQSMLNSSDIGSTDELVMVLTDHDYGDGNSETVSNDSSNIVVLYSHPAVGSEGQFITTSQGNIMINSETGVFELRNSESFVPISESSVLVGNGSQAASPQIESIEMIQREIDSHQKVKVEESYDQDIKPVLTESSKQEQNTQPIYIQQNVVENIVVESEQHDIPVTTPMHVEQEVPQVIQMQSEQTSVNVEGEEQTEVEMTSQSTLEKSIDLPQIPTEENDAETSAADKENVLDALPVPTTTPTEETKETSKEIGKEEELSQKEPEHETLIPPLGTSDDHNNESLSDAPMLTQQECFIDTSMPASEEQEQLEGINDQEQLPELEPADQQSKDSYNDHENSPMPVLEPQDPIEKIDSQVIQKETAEPEKDKEKEQVEQEQLTEVIIDEPENSSENLSREELASQKTNEDENTTSQDALNMSCESTGEEDAPEEGNNRVESEEATNYAESEVSQTFSEKESNEKQTEDKPSAKTILDEWEDTDSQQSGNTETKPLIAVAVHRLIDDWEDEEEEDSKKAEG